MTGIVGSLAGQIAIMFVIMALGFCLRRGGLVTEIGTRQLSDLVLYVANPVIIMQSLMMDFDPVKLGYAGFCFAFTFVLAFIGIGLARTAFRGEFRIAQFATVFSNCGFLGIPLVRGMLGQEYVFYLSVCNACLVGFMWTYGIFLVSGSKEEVSFKKIALNPCVIALAVGFACFLGSVHPAPIVNEILTDIADLNTGLVMIVLGSFLASCDLRSLIKSKLIYQVCLLRLVALPAIVMALLAIARMVPLEVALAVLIALATPAAATTAMFAERYGRDYRLGAGIVAMSTLLSMVTMPALVILAEAVLG